MKKKAPTLELPEEKLPSPPTIKILDAVDETESDTLADAEKEREMAVRAIPFTWQGKELAPFAIDREADWMLFRGLIEAPSLEVAFSIPGGFVADAVRILFFCSNEPSAWITLLSSPLELDAKIRGWSALNVPQGTQAEAVLRAIEIYNRAHSTQAVEKPDSKSKPGKSPRRRDRHTT